MHGDIPLRITQILNAHQIPAAAIKLHKKSGDNFMYIVDGRYVLKTSPEPFNEVEKQKRAEALAPVPKIYASGIFCTACGTQIADNDAATTQGNACATCCVSNPPQRNRLYYLLVEYKQGRDLWDAAPYLTPDQQRSIGKELAHFLRGLHAITDCHKSDAIPTIDKSNVVGSLRQMTFNRTEERYDIGHYVPTIPRFAGTWKQGHIAYIQYLQQEMTALDVKPHSHAVIDEAFRYMHSHIDALDYQAGARLLHNDLHPKNIIVATDCRESLAASSELTDYGQSNISCRKLPETFNLPNVSCRKLPETFSSPNIPCRKLPGIFGLTGIIDWECAQYGEADFDLAHLFHWCIYPDTPDIDLSPLLESLLDEMQITQTIPRFAQRMTIYQLEHDLNQLIWNGAAQEDVRVQRITSWLEGKVNRFTTTPSNAQSY